MTDIDSLCPPGVRGVPPEVTRIDGAFRRRVAAMIGGLFVFLLLYLLVIALTGVLVYWLATQPVLGLTIVGLAAAGLFSVFLVKGLFRRRRVERSMLLPIREDDQPELFAFIRRIYQEVGAPPPGCVYLGSDANAALMTDSSLLNLVVPPRHDLVIGLGLLNVVNLVEFKAVLAHEFGHFSQHSAGLSSYLYVADQAVRDVIYQRDALDRFVDRWSARTWGIAFPAWGLQWLLWAVRGLLSAMYRSLNPLRLSLSREMEFRADNAAVSLTGSDAPVHVLVRLDFALECLTDAARSLNAAADRGVFTDDLYFHQQRSAERLRRLRNDERLGLPPELPDDPSQSVTIFPPVNDGIPENWRTHPTNHARERNAKRYYVRSPLDDRSPWLLFRDPTAVRRQVTGLFYRHGVGRREGYESRPAAAVQEFIDAEHAETTYDPKYAGFYNDRFIEPGDLKWLPRDPWPLDQVTGWLAGWPPADLETRVRAFRQRQEEHVLLQRLKYGDLVLKGPTFELRGRKYTLKFVPKLLSYLEAELKSDTAKVHELDREVFLAHWSLARHLDEHSDTNSRATELLNRYRFHTAVQNLLRGMGNDQQQIRGVWQFLSVQRRMNEADSIQIRDTIEAIYRALCDNLEDAKRFEAPVLSNVPAGLSLYTLIADREDLDLRGLNTQVFSWEWLAKLMAMLDGVVLRIQRLHFKSLGGLLACQEKLANDWAAARLVTEGSSEV